MDSAASGAVNNQAEYVRLMNKLILLMKKRMYKANMGWEIKEQEKIYNCVDLVLNKFNKKHIK